VRSVDINGMELGGGGGFGRVGARRWQEGKGRGGGAGALMRTRGGEREGRGVPVQLGRRGAAMAEEGGVAVGGRRT
jgi:hypothetical protein